jgi:bifunctional non-homologous end joining protein LigD
VIEGAREVRDRLQDLGLVSFCKTTGGKGLHVVTPLSAEGLTWDIAKAFARDVCKAMAADPRPLPDHHGQEGSRRADLPGLSAQRSHGHGGRAAVAARPARRAGLDADLLDPGEEGPGSAKYTLRTVPALVRKLTAWETIATASGRSNRRSSGWAGSSPA